MCLQALHHPALQTPCKPVQAQRRVRGLQQSFKVDLKQGASAQICNCCDQHCRAVLCCLRLMADAL